MLVYHVKNKRIILLIIFIILIVDNIKNYFEIKEYQLKNNQIADLINGTNKSINEGIYKYVGQCHKYPNEVIKSIVQSNETLKQISIKYEFSGLENDGFFRINNGEF